MRGIEVIAVVAVLADELVVRLDLVLVAAASGLHTDTRLIRDCIEHRTGVLKIIIGRDRIWVEIDEITARTFVESRHARQIVETALVEPLSIAKSRVLVEQLAGTLVGPAVIGADEARAVAARLAAYRRSPVPAGIEERVDLAVDVAIEDQFPVHHLAAHEVAFLPHLDFSATDAPLPVYDAP